MNGWNAKFTATFKGKERKQGFLIKKKKGKQGSVTLEIDMSIAYDMTGWNGIKSLLWSSQYGFSSH